MRFFGTLLATLMLALALPQAVNLKGLGGFASDSPYNRLYSTRTVVTFSGKVTGVQQSPPLPGMSESKSLIVRAKNGGTIAVELGPVWYLDNQATKIKLNDQVQVTGSKVFIDGDSVILASQVLKGKQVLALRDAGGLPYWDASRTGRITIEDVELIPLEGTISEERLITIDGVDYIALVVDTPNGPSTVGLAPAWYMRRQEFPFRLGQTVTIYSRREPLRIGNVILADSIYNGTGTLILRTGLGAPVWTGWR